MKYVQYVWVGCMALAAVLGAVPAMAQLSDADIAALQAQAQQEGWTFSIRRTEASKQPDAALSGLKLPAPDDPYWQTAPQMPQPKEKADFPATWDWRTMNGVTPVKDQGGCGSCWAFSTLGAVESAIKIKDGIEVDLSEQHLLSCNTAGWGCSGAVWGYSWLINTPDSCGMVGAAFEADYPYQSARQECACAAPRHYRIQEWGYVNGLQPTESDIKYALMTYGPLGCSLCTSAAFHAYGGGVFNQCADTTVFDINHALLLVGWDDTKGARGAWIIKNSWGEDWGENGFCYIEYGCNRIGFAANYVRYEGPEENFSVSPLTGFSSSGPQGGPYIPPSTTYTLANTDVIPVSWSAVAPSWIAVMPADGTLDAGQSVDVSVSVSGAGAAGGIFGGDLVFTNLGSGAEQRRWMSLTLPKTPVLAFNLDTNPGWTTTGAWAFGAPTGFVGANGADPSSGATGLNVYGYNLSGYYENSMAEQYLTTGAMDFSGWQDVELRFMRWLGVESSRYDHARIQVSVNGTAWTTVWAHEGGNLAENAWNQRVYDISGVADNQPAVYVRWVMGTTDSSDSYAGWNLDDIEFRANPYTGEGEGEEGETPQCDIDALSTLYAMLLMIADTNGDSALSQAEVGIFVAQIAEYWEFVDLDGDGVVPLAEFLGNPMVVAFVPKLDTNGDNQLSLSEIQVLTEIITPELYTLLDVNQNGSVDCDDLGITAEGETEGLSEGEGALDCPDCTPSQKTKFFIGEDACLYVEGSLPDTADFVWSKEGVGILEEGRYVGVDCRTLSIPNLQVSDSGTYSCEYTGVKAIYQISIEVSASIPAANGAGIAALTLLGALLGALRLRHARPRG